MSEALNYIKLPLCNLEKNKHTFHFNVDTGFFSDFQDTEIIGGSAEVYLKAEQFDHFMNVVLTFSGTVTVACDRCLENLDIPVEGEDRFSIGFGEESYEESEDMIPYCDIIYVNPEDEEIDLSDYVYETICMVLPMQRVHGNDENGKSRCNPDMLKYISNWQQTEKESPFGILKDMNK
jgi:uncharacterized metal-binding protein YceD (DUF177 family)